MAKNLHIAEDMTQLESKSDLKIPKSTSYEKCLKLLQTLNTSAKNMRAEKDEEMEFFYLHRYFLFCSYLGKSDKMKNNNNNLPARYAIQKKAVLNKAKENLSRYDELKASLIKRYESTKKLPEAAPGEPKQVVSSRPACVTPTSGISTANEKGVIECNKLYSLLTSKALKQLVLVFDARPSSDFKASHLKYDNLLNIPAEILAPGLSADNLGKAIQDPQKLWGRRGEADLLVLMDWSSSSSLPDPHTSSKVLILKNILTLWDPLTSYKSKPVILEGGYEEVIQKYPHITTDPKVEIPRPQKSSSSDALSSLDYPMEELEPKLPSPPKVPDIQTPSTTSPSPSPGDVGDVSTVPQSTPKSAPAVVDRSTKPKTRFSPENMNRIIDELADSLSDEDEPPAEPVQPKENGGFRGFQSPPSDSSVDSSPIQPVATEDTTPMEYSSDEEAPSSQAELDRSRKPDPALVENLRKLKPANVNINNNNNRPDDSWNSRGDAASNTWNSAPNENGVSHEPLKKDGSSGGILRRSSSSPNISKLADDESTGTIPSFSRANKPVTPRKQFIFNERVDSTFGKTTPGLTGLKNFANNCYMNSIVQCLNNTAPLVSALIQSSSLNENHWRGRRQGKIAQEMIEAFRNMWSGEIRVYSIRELKSLMGEIKDIFKGSMHQDSNEFLIILLEHLHEDLNVPAEVGTLAGAVEETGEKAWGEFRRANCSIIQQLFYGQHKSTVKCESCGHASATFEQFFNLFVPIPSNQNSVTLDDCLQLYMSGERISGWKCPECKTERNATKKIDISRLPPVLVIALKRFTQEDDSWLHKKENLVTYPLDNLDMSRFTVPGSEQRHKNYSLYAMSTHSGTLRSGHYRAVCKNSLTRRWYMFDDASVDCLSEQSVLNNPEVYILFYISKQS